MRILSLSFFVGTLILLGFSELPATRSVVIYTGLILISAPLLYFKASRIIIIPLLFICAGFFWSHWQASEIVNTRLPQKLEGKDLVVRGVIDGIPVYTDDSVRFVLNISQLNHSEPGLPQDKRATGKIRISWYRDFPEGIQAGDIWQLQIRAKRPNGFMNPGGMDYEKWLFTQRIIATGYVRRSEYNRFLGTHWTGYADRIRTHVLHSIHNQVGENPSGAIAAALAIAWRNDISTQQWETLRRTGTSHLVAISGLHIGLVAGFGLLITGLIGWLFPTYLPIDSCTDSRRACRGSNGMHVCTFSRLYLADTARTAYGINHYGWTVIPSQYSFHNDIKLCITDCLLLDPLATLSPGFWLSFLSVLMIFLLSRRSITQNNKWLVLVIQLGISIGMIPLTAGLFGSVSLVSAPANLIAIPFVSLLVVPLVLLGVVALPLSENLAGWFWNLSTHALDGLFWFLDFLASFDWAAIHLPQLPWPWVLIAMGGFLLLILPRGIPGRWLGLVLLAPVILWQAERPQLNEFRLTVMDVGQGLASAIQTANHILIFDTGPKPSETFDAGSLVVLPWLRSQSYREIDTLIVSHADNDHSGGAEAILAAMPVKQILSNSKAILGSHNKEPCIAGKEWNWDGVTFKVIHPASDYQDKRRNNRSCVLKVSNANHSVLLTADIERPAEYVLNKRLGRALQSEVLVVPHHGSKSSSSPALLKMVEPELAIVTAGYRNRFHHPHPSVVKRYQDWGIPLLGTMDNGAIRVDFPNNDNLLAIHKYREQQRKFWNRD